MVLSWCFRSSSIALNRATSCFCAHRSRTTISRLSTVGSYHNVLLQYRLVPQYPDLVQASAYQALAGSY
eukprot:1469506-Rhodomonas_salina.4